MSGMICLMMVCGDEIVIHEHSYKHIKLDRGNIGENAKNIEKQDIENKREKEGRTYQMWRFELYLYKRNFSNLENKQDTFK